MNVLASTASFPTSGLSNPFAQPFFTVADVAQALGINEDTVTRCLRLRPSLFPPREGWKYEWTARHFPTVLAVVKKLSPKARKPR